MTNLCKIKPVAKCCTCNSIIDPKNYRSKFGRRYCSISCEDIGEEINQGSETLIFEED